MKIVYSFILCAVFSSIGYGQCYMDRHSTCLDDAWLSCSTQMSPNPVRGESHWIMYDFKVVHILGQSHFWNINTPGNTSMGASEIIIDYSNDGINWEEYGSFNITEAPASGFYEGELGPDFAGLAAQYVLLTVADNYGATCHGLSEVRFESLGISTSTEALDFTENSLNLHPNPASDFTLIEFESFKEQSLLISLMDLSGREILSQRHNAIKGDNRIRLDLVDINSGNYIIRIESQDSQISAQLSIQNK